MKFSIIIPVYNAKKYLQKCINSCINQTFDDYEIILINDGSTDGSDIICEEYSRKNRDIIFLSQNNCGLSATRNRGLRIAKGKYISFLDADDYIAEQYLETIYETMEKSSLEVVTFNYSQYEENGNFIQTVRPINFEKEKITSGIKFIENNGYNVIATAWNYVYSRKFIEDNHLLFAEGMFHEDCEWTAYWFPKAKRISYIDEALYMQVISQGSIMRSCNFKKCLDLITISKMVSKNAYTYKSKSKVVMKELLIYSSYLSYASIKSCVEMNYKIKELLILGKKDEILNQLKRGKRYTVVYFLLYIKQYYFLEMLIRLSLKNKKG